MQVSKKVSERICIAHNSQESQCAAISTLINVFSASSLRCQHDTARSRCSAPRLLAIDISCPRGALLQTRRTPLLLSIDGTDGRTDGRTLDRFIDPAPHTTRAVSILSLLTLKQ